MSKVTESFHLVTDKRDLRVSIRLSPVSTSTGNLTCVTRPAYVFARHVFKTVCRPRPVKSPGSKVQACGAVGSGSNQSELKNGRASSDAVGVCTVHKARFITTQALSKQTKDVPGLDTQRSARDRIRTPANQDDRLSCLSPVFFEGKQNTLEQNLQQNSALSFYRCQTRRTLRKPNHEADRLEVMYTANFWSRNWRHSQGNVKSISCCDCTKEQHKRWGKGKLRHGKQSSCK